MQLVLFMYKSMNGTTILKAIYIIEGLFKKI